MISDVANMDCMEYMKQFPDKFFDLAVVDPPYGIKVTKMTLGNGKNKVFRGESNWDDEAPGDDYFKELMRVSKDQIIWGANHFISRIPQDSSCWLVWDKGTGDNDFADCELAWTSLNKPVRKFFKSWVGNNAKEKGGERIHPTQKPIALYDWIFKKFARGGQKILDTHLGSGSSRIAAYHAGLDFYGCELDKEYFDKMNARFEKEIHGVEVFGETIVTQQSLFE
jgi:site-specific DNA-methyltransferase (adenine-specific)